MFGVQLGRDGADDITEGGMRISFSDGLALAGIALSIVLLVLDKAGKLKPGPILFLLLILAFLMTIPLALGNSWVSAAHSGLARIPRTLLALCLFGALFSSLAVYVSGAQNEEGRTAESAGRGGISILVGNGPWLLAVRNFGTRVKRARTGEVSVWRCYVRREPEP